MRTLATFCVAAACSCSPAHAFDWSIPIVGTSCSSVEATMEWANSGIYTSNVFEAEIAIIAFNDYKKLHCEYLLPVVVEQPRRVGSFKLNNGETIDIYSFISAGKTYYTSLQAEIPYA